MCFFCGFIFSRKPDEKIIISKVPRGIVDPMRGMDRYFFSTRHSIFGMKNRTKIAHVSIKIVLRKSDFLDPFFGLGKGCRRPKITRPRLKNSKPKSPKPGSIPHPARVWTVLECIRASPRKIGPRAAGSVKLAPKNACTQGGRFWALFGPCQIPLVPAQGFAKTKSPKVGPISNPEHGWTVLECIRASPRKIGPRAPPPINSAKKNRVKLDKREKCH